MERTIHRPRPELLREIEQFNIEGGYAAFSFARRLARENGWSLEYSERVIREYRRFLYLAKTAGHTVTPSDEVDQAWHLHMVYTESYWTRLCGEVFGEPLHHGPTKGGREESVKFTDLYERTLESYRTAFGEEPPGDIWPAAEERFRRAAQFSRVNVAENWVIPKPKILTSGLGAAGFAGCGLATTSGVTFTGIFILVGFICLIAIIILIAHAMSNRPPGSGGGGGGAGAGCGTFFGGGCGSSGDAGDAGGSGCGSSGCGSSGCGGGGCGGGCGS